MKNSLAAAIVMGASAASFATTFWLSGGKTARAPMVVVSNGASSSYSYPAPAYYSASIDRKIVRWPDDQAVVPSYPLPVGTPCFNMWESVALGTTTDRTITDWGSGRRMCGTGQ
jgi:hypothetical protein